MRVFEILIFLGLCLFTGAFIVMVLFDRSIQRSRRASPGSAYVSFSVCRNAAILLLLQPAISWLSSVSSGMNGRFSSCVYFGGVHWMLSIFARLL